MRSELGISPQKIVALYSGSMGRKQGLELLPEVIRELGLSRPDIHFVFCGDGTFRESLESAARNARNVTVLPLQPLEKLNGLLNLADIHLLPQCADAADLVMPSKLTGMLASGRPVVATAAAETQLFRSLQGKGLVTPPGDAKAFCEAIVCLADNGGLRRKLGVAGRAYAVACLDREAILTRLESSLLHLCRESSQKRHRAESGVSVDQPAMHPEQK
ncbi:MAG: hypothetical protein NVS9B13_04450 [Candidatus Acidiferrum sp.]